MADVMPIGEARSKLSEVIKTARYGRRPVFIGARGKAEVAVIDIDTYRALEDAIEEAIDIADSRVELAEYDRTKGESGRDIEDVFREIESRAG